MATRRSSRVQAAATKAPAPPPAPSPAPKKTTKTKKTKAAATPSKRQGLGGSAAPKTSAALGVVDPQSGLADDGVIYNDNGTVYDVMLNLQDLSQNMDKYYIIQVIHNQVKDEYTCYTHWGRTGTAGQNQQWTKETPEEAVELFAEKFKEKSGCDWDDRDNYAHKAGKYTWLKMNHAARATKSGCVWQYYIDDNVQGKKNDWYDYDPENSDVVEQLHDQYLYNQQMSQRIVHSDTSSYDYLVDLAAMTQTNQTSGKVRNIRRKVMKKEEEEEEEEEEDAVLAPATPAKGRKRAAAPAKAAKAPAPATPTKGRKRAVKQEEEEEEEEEEPTTPKKKTKAAAAPAAAKGRKRAAVKQEADEEDEEEEEEDAPKGKKGAKAATTPKKQKASSGKAVAAPSTPAPKVAKTGVTSASVNANDAAKAMGSGAVDPSCPFASSGQLEPGFDCMLNQTNISNNNNKFYLLQLVENGGKHYLWTRWGRVGEPGATQLQGPTDLAGAELLFEKKFKDKTGNNWADKDDFVAKSGKYEIVELDADAGGADPSAAGPSTKAPGKKRTSFPPSKLDPVTREFVDMIFDEDMFKESLSNMKVDVNKMPLGRLGQGQIDKGMAVLEDLEDAIKSNSRRNVLEDLTSKFYQIIPHSFGRARPPVIDSLATVQEKFDLLNVLGDVETAKGMADGTEETDQHPSDEKYAKLHADLELLPHNSDEYKMISKYTEATRSTGAKVQNVWKVDRHHEASRFNAHSSLSNRKLLWHGTNVAVVAAILKSGLRIMPHSGGRVGRGIYLASENGKSIWYTCGTQRKGKRLGVMFLVEAALGDEHHITRDDSSLKAAPSGYDCIIAKGHKEPDPAQDTSLTIDGKKVVVPQGKPITMPQYSNSSFNQSEYLIYKESQHRIRYAITIEM